MLKKKAVHCHRKHVTAIVRRKRMKCSTWEV